MKKFREGRRGRKIQQIFGLEQTYWGNGQRELKREVDYSQEELEVRWDYGRSEQIKDLEEIKEILASCGDNGNFHLPGHNGRINGEVLRVKYSSNVGEELYLDWGGFNEIGRKPHLFLIEVLRGTD